MDIESVPLSLELRQLKDGAGVTVLSACQLLRSQWPFAHDAPAMAPMILQNQLYFLLSDRSAVDTEISQLQKSNQIRVFKLSVHENQTELVIVLTDDYERSVRALAPQGRSGYAAATYSSVAVAASSILAAPSSRDLTRPASMPYNLPSTIAAAAAAASSSSTSTAASSSIAAAPVKSLSALPAWPSRGSILTRVDPTRPFIIRSADSSQTASRTSSFVAPIAPPIPKPSSAVSSSIQQPPFIKSEKQATSIKRRRSSPSTAAAASTTAAASSSIDLSEPTPNANKKLKREHTSPMVISSPAAAASSTLVTFSASIPKLRTSSSPSGSSVSSAPPPPHATGVARRLNVSLSDYATDERFPSMEKKEIDEKDTAKYADAADDVCLLLELFLTHLTPHYTDVSITREHLLNLLYFPHSNQFVRLTTSDAIVSCLLHLGLIVLRSATSYYFTLPHCRRLLVTLDAGRKELIQRVKRRQYHESPLSELLAKPTLKNSPCRVEFHLREMLGSEDQLAIHMTTMGPIVRTVRRDGK